MKARSMVTRRSLPARPSLWQRLWDDLGQPPTPGWRDALVAAFVLFVLLAFMALEEVS